MEDLKQPNGLSGRTYRKPEVRDRGTLEAATRDVEGEIHQETGLTIMIWTKP